MEPSSAEQVVAELGLTAEELLTLTVLQQVMLTRDLVAETDTSRIATKQRYRNAFASAAAVAHWSRDDLPDWAHEPARAIAERVPAQQRRALEAAAAVFGAQVATRSRALLVLIELVAFHPWGDQVRWVRRTHRTTLAAVAALLPALRPGDLEAVTTEFDAVLRALARQQVRWGRVAADPADARDITGAQPANMA